MLKLVALIYIIAGATLAGILVLVALTMGYDTSRPIMWAAITGFVLGVPVTWAIARKLSEL